MFSPSELEYLTSQPLMRLATVDGDGQPTVDVVGFQFRDGRFLVGGHGDTRTRRRHRNVRAGHNKIGLVIDDLAALDPWTPRGIRVTGSAEIVNVGDDGMFGPGEYLQITPTVSWSWGIGPENGPAFENGRFTPRRVAWR